MNRIPSYGEAPRPEYTRIRFSDFEVYWAGPRPFQPQGFCFGSEDGRLLFTDEKGEEQYRSDPLSDSKEAVNGVAQLQRFLAVSTRQEINFWDIPQVGAGKPSRTVFHHGAHDVAATSDGYFVAPLGRTGIMSMKPAAATVLPVTVTSAAIEGFSYYQLVCLPVRGGPDVLICAGRRGGLAVTEFWGAKKGTQNLGTISFDGFDAVDVCAIGSEAKPRAVAALARDGKLILLQDALHDRNPVTLKFNAITGTAYRVLSGGGDLFVLTSQGLYVLAGFAERFVQGEEMGRFPTTILTMPMEAVDATLCMDRWLLAVMPDEVRRFDLGLIRQSMSASVAGAEIRESRPDQLAPHWQEADMEQETRQLETVA